MRKRTRLAVTACLGVAALTLPASALARFVPKLVVSQSPPTTSSKTTTISIQMTREDDAPLRIAFYTPRGYQGTVAQAPNTELGSVNATVQAKAISADAILQLTGVVRSADPATFVMNPQAIACAGAAQHTAVWLLVLEAAGQTLTVPLYVDAVTAGPEAAFASFRIVLCLPSPDIPVAQGGATFGAKVLVATLNLRNVYTAPSSSGTYVWPGIFTPYTAGTGTPNPAGTVEARGIVRLPGQLTFSAASNRARRTIAFGGAVTEGGAGVASATVDILAGTKRLFRRTTGANGRYAAATRKRGRPTAVTYRARAVVPARDVTSTACGPPTVTAAPCVSATTSAYTLLSRAIRIRL